MSDSEEHLVEIQDAFEPYARRIAELEAELHTGERHHTHDGFKALNARIAELEAEVERLRSENEQYRREIKACREAIRAWGKS